MSAVLHIDGELRGTLDLAIQIADAAVRSDIECFAAIASRGESQAHTVYDTSRICDYKSEGGATEAADLEVIQRALRYIEQRRAPLPFVLYRDAAQPHLVWFEDRPAPAPMTEQQRMDSEYAQAVDRG
ncbi:hypothetical protein V3391_06705 [Luteimonas sp. SMYT11W]|uniref:Uncharacterized protein n=1 Tax=Luteimonas flava TaxID=3115822 RepID=A0ABU7WD57_9GAMM